MTCRECSSAKKGYFASRPDEWVCIGVKEPFIISDIDAECTEYPYLRKKLAAGKIGEIKYGIVQERSDGTVLWYEPITDKIDGFVLRTRRDDLILKTWVPTEVDHG